MSKGPWTAAAIRGDDTGYLAYHSPRYAFLLGVLERHLPTDRQASPEGPSRLLDVGPSPFTDLLRRRFGLPVDTLGFGEDRPGHYSLDLNTCGEAATLRQDLPAYRAIVFAEVLEHLPTAPRPVLAYLAGLLDSDGILVLQTPNAASLPKRLKLFAGRNPYDRIREDSTNPGHFREYTRAELEEEAARAGFQVLESHNAYYFDARFAHHNEDGSGAPPTPRARLVGGLKNALYRALPAGLREGLTLAMSLRRDQGQRKR